MATHRCTHCNTEPFLFPHDNLMTVINMIVDAIPALQDSCHLGWVQPLHMKACPSMHLLSQNETGQACPRASALFPPLQTSPCSYCIPPCSQPGHTAPHRALAPSCDCTKWDIYCSFTADLFKIPFRPLQVMREFSPSKNPACASSSCHWFPKLVP